MEITSPSTVKEITAKLVVSETKFIDKEIIDILYLMIYVEDKVRFFKQN